MKLSEHQLIEKIRHLLPLPDSRVICSVGDDCAVVESRPDFYSLLTTDSLVENVHFRLASASPFDVGFKAFQVNLSDVAAMGGVPLQALVSLGLPSSIEEAWVDAFYQGLLEAAKPHQVSIVGGNITRSDTLFISLTLIGEVSVSSCKFRKGSRNGDAVYVTGFFGSSALGFHLLEKGVGVQSSPFVERHLRPKARVAEGIFLGSCPEVHSLIDISDGLVGDLGHLLKAGSVGAEISLQDIPVDPALVSEAKKWGLNWQDLVLAGGEDYELLFSVDPASEKAFLERARKLSFSFHRIGNITEEKAGLKISGISNLSAYQSFDHFKS